MIVISRKRLVAIANADDTAIAELRCAGNVTELAVAQLRATNAKAVMDLSIAQSNAMKARERLTMLLDLPGISSSTLKWPGMPDSLPSDSMKTIDLQSIAIHRRLDLAVCAAYFC